MRFALASLLLLAACGTAEEAPVDDVEAVEPAVDPVEGKTDGVTGNVEIKLAVRDDQRARALGLFKLRDATASRRTVWFYDTKALALFDSGVLLRTRKVQNGPDDSTVKLRPMDARRVARSWLALDGFKCEEDRTGTRSVMSCSLSAGQDRGEIDQVAQGSRRVDQLFSADQERFLSTYASRSVPWTSLQPLGPIDSRVWKVSVRGLPWPMAAERWVMLGRDLLELSIRVPGTSADAAAAQFYAYLQGKGLDTATRQETKTRVAMEQFANP